MDGDILAFDDDTQEGIVEARDGQHYSFELSDWRGRGLPAPRLAVRFTPRGSRAEQLINLPEAQRKARASRPAPPHDDVERAPSRRHSGLSLAAITLAFLALFFDGQAPLMALGAAVLGVLGLRQIHKSPRRFSGRLFCWGAIGLALLVALLSTLVEPALEPLS